MSVKSGTHSEQIRSAPVSLWMELMLSFTVALQPKLSMMDSMIAAFKKASNLDSHGEILKLVGFVCPT